MLASAERARAVVSPDSDPLARAFEREAYALLGLPFDALDLDAAAALVRRAAEQRERCVFATPNLNFVTGCRGDAAFRDSVLAADLSIADGMPIVWIARLLGVPLPGRVAGADLFERLRADAGRPLSVYFFGGAEGAARAAAE